MYMVDIKLVAVNEKEQETLIQALIIYIQDIWTEIVIKKYAKFIMRS